MMKKSCFDKKLQFLLNQVIRKGSLFLSIASLTSFNAHAASNVNIPVLRQNLLVSNPILTNAFSLSDNVQDGIVKGFIADVSGMPLPGANVVVISSNIGAVADFDGNYTIKAKRGDVLVFSYLGMQKKSITVGDTNNINVVLEEDANALEEVIVVGYGTQKKATLAGAVDQIGAKVFEDRPVTNVVNALQGAVPGLTVTRSGGQPGEEGYDLTIRGFSSINGGNSPLVIIDGIPGSLDLINPNDVQNVTVLKDAAASIYGARAAGGVLLITTKRGKKGAPKIDITSSYSINKATNFIETVDVRGYAEMEIEAAANAGSTSPWVDFLDEIDSNAPRQRVDPNFGDFWYFQTTDWNDITFETGSQQQHNVSVSGGGENTNYLFSAGYVKTDGIIAPAVDDNERLNLRMNYDFDITDRLKLETRISMEDGKQRETADVHVNNRLSGTDRALGIPINNYVWFPAYTPEGNPSAQWGFGNALGAFKNGLKQKKTQVFRTNLKLSYELLDGLTFHGQAGITSTNENLDNITKQVQYYNGDDEPIYFEYGTDIPFAYKQNEKSTYRNYTSYFDYDVTIDEKHDIHVTGGASHEENDNEWFFAQRQGFSQDQLFTLNLGGTDNVQANGGASDWAIQSLFGRLNYVFDSKYIAEFTYRRDGTSRFSSDQRWGNFYGVFGAWVLTEENFMEKQNIFDNLKLRASWGQTGNENAGGLYDYQSRINLGTFNYAFGSSPSATLSAGEAGLVSTIRTWEKLETTNFGFDASFLKSRLNLSFDYFLKNNDNMLVGVNLPSVLGGSPPAQNIGELEIKGWELALGWNDQTDSGFSYGVNFNLADNTNKLVNLNGLDVARAGLNGIREGHSINSYFGYQFEGLIQTQEQLDAFSSLENVPTSLLGLGDAMFADLNGDGRLSEVDDEGNDADIVNLGTTDPRYTFGVNLNAAYKGWDFSAFIQGVGKRTHFYQGDFSLPFSQPWRPPIKRFYNTTWSPDRTDAEYPRLNHSDVRWSNYRASTLQKQNGAYARLKNITVGYTLPSDIMENNGIERIRIYVGGEDLFTLSHLDGGYDPENSSGYENAYPFTKRFTFGLNITF